MKKYKYRKKKLEKKLSMFIPVILVLLCFFHMNSVNAYAKSKSVVEKRLDDVRTYYPEGSRINSWINSDEGGFTGGGCNALVMFATMRIFHVPFTADSDNYTQVSHPASTKNKKKLKKLFAKAKVGDEIRWIKDYNDAHNAIFLSGDKNGIYVYEANFKSKNLVWDKHYWKWENMPTWPTGGANKVAVYHADNYNAVNRKKAACNFKKGDTFEVSGIEYKVVKCSPTGGEVRITGYEDDAGDKKKPAYLYLRIDDDMEITQADEGYGKFSRNKNANASVTYKVVK